MPDIYRFIIVFKDPNQQKKFLEAMDDLGIPEEFSEQINKDIIENKCDKKDLSDWLEADIFCRTWDEFHEFYGDHIYWESVKELLKETVATRLKDEMHYIPKLAYYSVIGYPEDDFCYEILKQLMPELDCIYKCIKEE